MRIVICLMLFGALEDVVFIFGEALHLVNLRFDLLIDPILKMLVTFGLFLNGRVAL